MRLLAYALLFSSLAPAFALAQDALDEPRARELRENGRQRVRDGRLEEAFDLYREASLRTSDPTVWLELAEVADRLRLDVVALSAYELYLERRADAPERAEILGRIRILREIVAGGRFVLDEGSVERQPPPPRDVLVDWYGRPLVLRRSSGLISLADWDGTVRRRPPAPERFPDLLPFRAIEPGLGRRLSDP